MRLVTTIAAIFLIMTSVMFARGQDEYVPAPPLEYEFYFRSLTPEEQAARVCPIGL